MRLMLTAAMAAMLAATPAIAQNRPGTAGPAAAAKEAQVEGFRNARFGMTEAQVRDAIGKDFKLSGDAIQRVEEPTERTTALIVKVNDLLPESGPAVIAYLLGYKTKKLFRVNVIWGQEIGSPSKPEQIVGTANALRNYLLGQGYRQEGLILNQSLGDDNVLVFQGNDVQGRLTELILGITKKPPAKPDAQPEVAGASLRLSYVEKPKEPDIYRVPGGF
jgi:opacity protein-like surface antigen